MKRTMNLKAAMELVDDGLPDGAYWAMVHDIAGAEYGECWDELQQEPIYFDDDNNQVKKPRTIECEQCKRKFPTMAAMLKHEAAMARNGTHKRIHGQPSKAELQRIKS